MGNASTGTKGKGKSASAPPVIEDYPLCRKCGTWHLSAACPTLLPPSILSFKSLIEDLRQIRDERLYTREDFHCFRAWTMHTFGEKLGGWLDDIL